VLEGGPHSIGDRRSVSESNSVKAASASSLNILLPAPPAPPAPPRSLPPLRESERGGTGNYTDGTKKQAGGTAGGEWYLAGNKIGKGPFFVNSRLSGRKAPTRRQSVV
jgi:hypothetical protein